MGKLWLALSLSVLLSAAGCGSPRSDYLEPETENAFLKNLGRASTVLSPIGMSTNILISEIRRDIANSRIRRQVNANEAVAVKNPAGHDVYVVHTIDVAASKSDDIEAMKDKHVYAGHQNTYYIVDEGREYILNLAQ